MTDQPSDGAALGGRKSGAGHSMDMAFQDSPRPVDPCHAPGHVGERRPSERARGEYCSRTGTRTKAKRNRGLASSRNALSFAPSYNKVR